MAMFIVVVEVGQASSDEHLQNRPMSVCRRRVGKAPREIKEPEVDASDGRATVFEEGCIAWI